MKKILQYFPSFDYGGIETFILNINKGLCKECQFTYLVEKDINEENKKKIDEYGGKIIRIPNMTKQNPIKHILAIKKVFKENNYDVVHIHNCDLRFWVAFFAKMYKVPIRIYHIHSAKIERHSNIKKIFFNINIKLSTAVLACSKHAANEMLKDKAEKAIVVNNPIDVKSFIYNEEYRKNIRSELNIDDDTIAIGNVARLEEVKNHYFLIDVLENMLQKNIKAKLILVGEGSLKEKLKDIAKEKGIEDNFICMGKRSDTNKIYSAFDVFCLPSEAEGLGIVLIEAQANGLNCIASKNITEETNITGKINYIDIKKQNIVEWTEKIEEKSKTRYEAIKKIYEKGYDISDVEKVMLKIYNGGEKLEIN